ncbi:hypothetical protein [Lentzea sp. CC55]|uniref:hypothetical protein n=1 Tax=Lentzea sp. CC55 TaxID=2884909 RepID=UPI001F2BD149|nr:hypothetical protein [Lentzea sp. CC55]MCG8922550.1 hypothetical protein [Lentzea sp. CC55]
MTAGLTSVAFLLGLLWVAVDRGPNDAYIALVAVTTAGLVTGIVVGTRRRSRRRGDRLGTSGEATGFDTHFEKEARP